MARTKPTSTAKRTKTASELPRPRYNTRSGQKPTQCQDTISNSTMKETGEIIPKGGKGKKAVKKNIAPTKKHTTRTKKTLDVKPKETESRNEVAEQTSSQMDIRKLATDTLNAQVDSLILSLDKFQAAMNENDQSGNVISLRNDLLLYLIERHGFSIKEGKMKRNNQNLAGKVKKITEKIKETTVSNSKDDAVKVKKLAGRSVPCIVHEVATVKTSQVSKVLPKLSSKYISDMLVEEQHVKSDRLCTPKKQNELTNKDRKNVEIYIDTSYTPNYREDSECKAQKTFIAEQMMRTGPELIMTYEKTLDELRINSRKLGSYDQANAEQFSTTVHTTETTVDEITVGDDNMDQSLISISISSDIDTRGSRSQRDIEQENDIIIGFSDQAGLKKHEEQMTIITKHDVICDSSIEDSIRVTRKHLEMTKGSFSETEFIAGVEDSEKPPECIMDEKLVESFNSPIISESQKTLPYKCDDALNQPNSQQHSIHVCNSSSGLNGSVLSGYNIPTIISRKSFVGSFCSNVTSIGGGPLVDGSTHINTLDLTRYLLTTDVSATEMSIICLGSTSTPLTKTSSSSHQLSDEDPLESFRESIRKARPSSISCVSIDPVECVIAKERFKTTPKRYEPNATMTAENKEKRLSSGKKVNDYSCFATNLKSEDYNTEPQKIARRATPLPQTIKFPHDKPKPKGNDVDVNYGIELQKRLRTISLI